MKMKVKTNKQTNDMLKTNVIKKDIVSKYRQIQLKLKTIKRTFLNKT